MRYLLMCLCLLGSLSIAAPLGAEDAKPPKALVDARAALAAKDYDKACTLAEAAMAGKPSKVHYREAVVIRGEGYLGQKNTKKGVAWLREVLLLLEANVPLSDAEQDLWTRARKAIGAASPDDAGLHKKMSKQSGKMVSISKKWLKKDPKAAERAALAALALDPASKRARAAFDAARKAMGAVPQELLEVAKMAGWRGLTDKNWPRENGVLVGFVDKTAMMLTTEREWTGNFDVVLEARVIEFYSNNGPPLFALACPFVSDSRYVTLSCMAAQAELYEWTSKRDGKTHAKKAYKELGKKVDPKDWVRYELRARDDELIALVNGNEIGRQLRPDYLKTFRIGMKVQFCKVEVRSVKIVRR